MGFFDEVKEDIDRGIEGLNTGLPMGSMTKLLQVVPNIQQKTYYLVSGEPGGGKSAFALNSFLFNPFSLLRVSNPNNLSFKVFLWALEIPKRDIIAKAICRKLYFKHGYLVDINHVLSRGKNRITDEVYRDAMELSAFFEEIEDILEIHPPTNPTGIYNRMRAYAEESGQVVYKDVPDGKGGTISVFDRYVPNNPNEYVIIITDHVGLLKKERGFDSKNTIDKASEYMVSLRNMFGYIPVMVQQISRAMSSTDRFKLKRVEPQLSDLKGTANTVEDANIVFSLFSPARYDFEDHRGYDITKLADRYRYLSVLKNRDGEADVGLGLNFIGEIGAFRELPDPRILQLEGFSTYTDFNKIENFVETIV